jgi:hypothetical protein
MLPGGATRSLRATDATLQAVCWNSSRVSGTCRSVPVCGRGHSGEHVDERVLGHRLAWMWPAMAASIPGGVHSLSSRLARAVGAVEFAEAVSA